jgi:DNA polymerase/3'-5' exonuclease PolX
MSGDTRIPIAQAQRIAAEASVLISHLCQTLTIAGSIRRQREDVGDIEIVVIPSSRSGLLVRLDNLVEKGVIEKALYRHVDNKGNESLVPRWGEKLRCFRYKGVTVELAITNQENYGYTLWLKTGPAEANEWVMRKLIEEKAAIRFHDGYGWLTEYSGETPMYKHKLSIPDEATFFKVLRLPIIVPRWRTGRIYETEWTGSASVFLLRDLIIKEPEQKRLI